MTDNPAFPFDIQGVIYSFLPLKDRFSYATTEKAVRDIHLLECRDIKNAVQVLYLSRISSEVLHRIYKTYHLVNHAAVIAELINRGIIDEDVNGHSEFQEQISLEIAPRLNKSTIEYVFLALNSLKDRIHWAFKCNSRPHIEQCIVEMDRAGNYRAIPYYRDANPANLSIENICLIRTSMSYSHRINWNIAAKVAIKDRDMKKFVYLHLYANERFTFTATEYEVLLEMINDYSDSCNESNSNISVRHIIGRGINYGTEFAENVGFTIDGAARFRMTKKVLIARILHDLSYNKSIDRSALFDRLIKDLTELPQEYNTELIYLYNNISYRIARLLIIMRGKQHTEDDKIDAPFAYFEAFKRQDTKILDILGENYEITTFMVIYNVNKRNVDFLKYLTKKHKAGINKALRNCIDKVAYNYYKLMQ